LMRGKIDFLIGLIFFLAIIPVVITSVQTLNATASTWVFTAHAGAQTILGLIPFGVIAGLVIWAIDKAMSD